MRKKKHTEETHMFPRDIVDNLSRRSMTLM